jgi:hypothetical protein
MIKEIIKDLEREEIIEIVGGFAAWSGLGIIVFMLSVICG